MRREVEIFLKFNLWGLKIFVFLQLKIKIQFYTKDIRNEQKNIPTIRKKEEKQTRFQRKNVYAER